MWQSLVSILIESVVRKPSFFRFLWKSFLSLRIKCHQILWKTLLMDFVINQKSFLFPYLGFFSPNRRLFCGLKFRVTLLDSFVEDPVAFLFLTQKLDQFKLSSVDSFAQQDWYSNWFQYLVHTSKTSPLLNVSLL